MRWIKIVTDIFDDEKIRIIRSLPKGDAMLNIWFQLLCFAGKLDDNGILTMSGEALKANTIAMLLGRPPNLLKRALELFERFEMIERIGDVIAIRNWEKYQKPDAYERKKERDRIYQQRRYQERRTQILAEFSAENSDDVSPLLGSHEIETEIEGEREEDDDDIIVIPRDTGDVPAPDPLVAYATEQLLHLSPTHMEELLGYRESLSDELIRSAIDQACANGVRNYAYLRAILNRYVERGFKNIDDVLAFEEKRRRRGGTHNAIDRGNFDAEPRCVFEGETVL